jgi:hypothetical protein
VTSPVGVLAPGNAITIIERRAPWKPERIAHLLQMDGRRTRLNLQDRYDIEAARDRLGPTLEEIQPLAHA